MFKREILENLEAWASGSHRKPLILRGARQVGKTSAVHLFAERYDRFIALDLEKASDRALFTANRDFQDLLQAIFFSRRMEKNLGNTLLFIDEIQEEPGAIEQLRYFYEEAAELHVIAAGSLLEAAINRNVSFPVGRVEYRILRPLNFREFLGAMGEDEALAELRQVPVRSWAHDTLTRLYRIYETIGGMPEIVSRYAEEKDLVSLRETYEAILVSYADDVEKYARNDTLVQVMRHVIRTVFEEAGQRIRFHGFGKSNYRSREVGEAMRSLEKAMLLQLIYPVTQTQLPLRQDKRKSPRLQLIDTGLVSYFAGLQGGLIGAGLIRPGYRGVISEHLTGQELLSLSNSPMHHLNFWVREKKTSNAEVDFVWPNAGRLIPVEVKSGPTGSLRSLHSFMDSAPHDVALRFYDGKPELQKTKTIQGKPFDLISLPHYCATQIDAYLAWLESERSGQ